MAAAPAPWQEFQSDEAMRAGIRTTISGAPNHLPFVFQQPDGRYRYVYADRELIGRICLGIVNVPNVEGEYKFRRHAFEHLAGHTIPMILFAQLEYFVAMNPTINPEFALSSMVKVIRQAAFELLVYNRSTQEDARIRVNSMAISVATCHRGREKVEFHLRIPIVVQNMKAQQAFWMHVRALIRKERAQYQDVLIVNTPTGPSSIIKMSNYEKDGGQLMQCLGSARNDEESLHFLVPEGRPLSSITIDEWSKFLILRPRISHGVNMPTTWYPKEATTTADTSSSSSSSSSASLPTPLVAPLAITLKRALPTLAPLPAHSITVSTPVSQTPPPASEASPQRQCADVANDLLSRSTVTIYPPTITTPPITERLELSMPEDDPPSPESTSPTKDRAPVSIEEHEEAKCYLRRNFKVIGKKDTIPPGLIIARFVSRLITLCNVSQKFHGRPPARLADVIHECWARFRENLPRLKYHLNQRLAYDQNDNRRYYVIDPCRFLDLIFSGLIDGRSGDARQHTVEKRMLNMISLSSSSSSSRVIADDDTEDEEETLVIDCKDNERNVRPRTASSDL